MLDRYFGEWRYVKTGLTGDDLREMGLKPGPPYLPLLEQLLAARLDGRVMMVSANVLCWLNC